MVNMHPVDSQVKVHERIDFVTPTLVAQRSSMLKCELKMNDSRTGRKCPKEIVGMQL